MGGVCHSLADINEAIHPLEFTAEQLKAAGIEFAFEDEGMPIYRERDIEKLRCLLGVSYDAINNMIEEPYKI